MRIKECLNPANTKEHQKHVGIIEIIRMWFKIRKFNKIKKHADLLRLQTGQQQFVVMMNGQIQIVGRNWFKYHRQHGSFRTKDLSDLKRQSLYYTKR